MRRYVIFSVVLLGVAACSDSGRAPVAVDKSGDGSSVIVETEVTLKPTTTTSTSTTTSTTIPVVVIPNVENYDKDVALQTLNDLGLRAELVPVESSESPDSVVGVSPEAGSEVIEGSVVEVNYAVPALHSVTVSYFVEEPTWINGTWGKGPCEHRDYNVREGQSLLLIGPNGEILASTAVENGGRGEHPEFRTPCEFEFVFEDVPEVASYELETPDGSRFPAYSLNEAKDLNWVFAWEVSYS